MKQVKEGNGLLAQESRCRKKVEESGYHLAEVYLEKGISGSKLDRPTLNQLLQDVAAYKAKNKAAHTIVVVDDNSRLSRDYRITFVLLAKLHELNTTLEYVNHSYDNTPEGKALEAIHCRFLRLRTRCESSACYRKNA
jgi:DNA invertase Pin-like site-specific DNA recombinase